MDAGHFVGKHGADLVRLWASSIDYTTDVPFSEEIFTRLGRHISPDSEHAADFAWESL